MTRKESEKDAERPHYYSQFWLDIAAGRRTIGTPKPNEEGDAAEAEVALPEPVSLPRRPVRASDHEQIHTAASDGHIENPAAEPAAVADDYSELDEEEEELDLADADIAEPIYEDAPVADTDIPDMDLSPVEETEEVFGEEDEEEEDEEEEEEDGNWVRGRKKPKPTRVIKQPLKKPGKRDTRRPGY